MKDRQVLGQIEINEIMKMRRAERKKRNKHLINQMSKMFNNLNPILFIVSKVAVFGFVIGLYGYASKDIIYALNKPLGMTYASYASYFATALAALVFSSYFLKEKEKNK